MCVRESIFGGYDVKEFHFSHHIIIFFFSYLNHHKLNLSLTFVFNFDVLYLFGF